MQVPFLDIDRLHRPIRHLLDAAYRRVVDSSWYIMGPELEAFEAEFAAYSGVRYCIGVGNGLEALRLPLQAGGRKARQSSGSCACPRSAASAQDRSRR